MEDDNLTEIRKKIINIKNNIVFTDTHYSELDSKINIILNQIEIFLPNEKKHLCRELDQLYSLQEGVSDEIVYMYALKNIDIKE